MTIDTRRLALKHAKALPDEITRKIAQQAILEALDDYASRAENDILQGVPSDALVAERIARKRGLGLTHPSSHARYKTSLIEAIQAGRGLAAAGK